MRIALKQTARKSEGNKGFKFIGARITFSNNKVSAFLQKVFIGFLIYAINILLPKISDPSLEVGSGAFVSATTSIL